MQLVKREINRGASWQQLNEQRLNSLKFFEEYFEPNSRTLQRLFEMENHGLQLAELAHFIACAYKPASRVALVERQFDCGVTAQMLNYQRLILAETLENYLGPDSPTMKRLFEMENQGLYLSHLVRYVSEQPESRKAWVETTINKGATAKQIMDRIKLEVLPDDVADQIVEALGLECITATRLREHLQDLNTGPYLYDLVVQHVRTGKPLSAADAQRLLIRAQELARDSQGRQNDVKPTVQTTVRRSGDANINDTAQMVKQVATRILEQVPSFRTVVLLGRDTWPLVPILRFHGRRVQYFHWSRLQLSDVPTQQQWLKEVPPDSVVIDTGYFGSILDAIRKVDRSIDGFLISSSGKYPQLYGGVSHADIVAQIERFPKLPGRCSSYSSIGTAICRKGNRDSDESSVSQWEAIRKSQELLAALDLPPWYVWRYRTFLGGSPLERLGLSSSQDISQHYEWVKRLRRFG
ncbi:MAG: hypothetical protein HY711_00660 [Candidatus Melainabacteria bacterium]|nr:hypothetical protein [Candidatus Melainabacteria bacterium]